MRANDIRELTTEEIRARLKDEQDRLVRLRLNHAVSAIEKPSEMNNLRREIARMKTILHQRSMAETQTEQVDE